MTLGQYANNLFKGTVLPIKPKHTMRVPAWRSEHYFNEKTLYPTRFRVEVSEPSVEYPEPSIFIYCKNNGGNIFIRTNIVEFSTFVSKMGDWLFDVLKLEDSLKTKTQTMIEAQKKIDEIRNTVETLKQFQEMQTTQDNNTGIGNQVEDEE